MKKITLLILTSLLLLTGCKKENVNKEGIQKDGSFIVDGYSIKVVSTTYENSTSNFVFEVTNTNEEDATFDELEIHVKDSNNEVIATMFGYIDKVLMGKESTTFETHYDGDVIGYDSIEYTINTK